MYSNCAMIPTTKKTITAIVAIMTMILSNIIILQGLGFNWIAIKNGCKGDGHFGGLHFAHGV